MKSLLQMYHDLKESGSTSDFPNILGNSMYKVLIDKFKGINSIWREVAMIGTLQDFRPHDRTMLGEAEDLLPIEEDGVYKDSKLTDYKYQITCATKGRKFTIGRRVIINDDLQALKTVPMKFGRAAGRGLAKGFVDILEGSHNAYDSIELFDHSTHNNIINTTLTNTAAGAGVLATAIARMQRMTFDGEIMGITPKGIVVPPEMEDTVIRLINSDRLLPTSTNGGGDTNVPFRRLKVLTEPFLTSTTTCYLVADPEDAPFVEIGFLKGKQTPDLLMLKANTINLAGGEDPWGFEFDDIQYKVRYDWGMKPAMYQGVIKIGA